MLCIFLFNIVQITAVGRPVAMSLSHPTAVKIQLVYSIVHEGCGAEDEATIMIILLG